MCVFGLKIDILRVDNNVASPLRHRGQVHRVTGKKQDLVMHHTPSNKCNNLIVGKQRRILT